MVDIKCCTFCCSVLIFIFLLSLNVPIFPQGTESIKSEEHSHQEMHEDLGSVKESSLKPEEETVPSTKSVKSSKKRTNRPTSKGNGENVSLHLVFKCCKLLRYVYLTSSFRKTAHYKDLRLMSNSLSL